MEVILFTAAILLLTIIAIMLARQLNDLEKRIRLLEKISINTEYRCPECKSRDHCPAAFTGVAYPCEHFEKEDPNGNEK